MKTNVFRADWLIPVLGIVLLVGGYSVTKSYYGTLEDIHLGEQFNATIDRLRGDCRLSRVLSEAQDTGCTVTAQSLDELLVTDMAALNAELQSAQPQARALAEVCFEYIARRRAQNPPLASHLPAGREVLQLAGPRLAEQTLGSE
jgi:hypothetical protein